MSLSASTHCDLPKVGGGGVVVPFPDPDLFPAGPVGGMVATVATVVTATVVTATVVAATVVVTAGTGVDKVHKSLEVDAHV